MIKKENLRALGVRIRTLKDSYADLKKALAKNTWEYGQDERA